MDSLTPPLRATLKQIAWQARRWAMRNRHRFNTDESVFEADLNGMCAIASAELFRRLQAAGIPCQLALRSVPDDGHCFVLTETHLVDITASQFRGYPAVVLIPKEPRARREAHWQETRRFDSVEALVGYQRQIGWWPCQVPRLPSCPAIRSLGS